MVRTALLAILPAAFGLHAFAPRLRPGGRLRAQHLRLCAADDDESSTADVDWREVRAKLVQQESGSASAAGEAGGFVYESPLIEQGSVILGGTQQEFGFALRQQYFHKSVMLLLQHDDGFTKGIILNRPSAYELDGWRVWFGGDVAEGAMFRGEAEAKGEREIICLHALTGEEAGRLSLPVIKGVSCARAAAATHAARLARPRAAATHATRRRPPSRRRHDARGRQGSRRLWCRGAERLLGLRRLRRLGAGAATG